MHGGPWLLVVRGLIWLAALVVLCGTATSCARDELGDAEDFDDGDSEGDLPDPEPFAVVIRHFDGACGIAFGDDAAEREADALEEAGCDPDGSGCTVSSPLYPARSIVGAATANGTDHYSMWNATSSCADLEAITLDGCDEGRDEELPPCAIVCTATVPGC